MTDRRIPAAGDAFYAAKAQELEERYRHELMDVEERQEPLERILRLRRRVQRGESA